MLCRAGCAWETLSFEVPRRGIAETVDQFGVNGQRSTSETPDELAEFKFSIAKVRGEFKLIGLDGTTWETLTFKFTDDKVGQATLSAGGVRVR